MVSQVERYYPRTRRAVGPVSQTDRFYDDTRNDVRCPYADELGELDEVKKHLGRKDNPHGVTAEQVGALTETAADGRYVRVPPDAETIVLNHLLRGLRFYAHNDAEAGPDGNSPFFVIGSQLSGGQLREDRWVAKIFYNAIEFLRAPGTERVLLEFNRPGEADRATSEAIVLWKEMVAALAEATEGLIGADGGTVGGVLRMKNPKVSADDDTRHDIALVPNANGQGLQVQFPGGSTAMIRMKTGELATVAEVNAGLAAKQDKLIAGSGISIAEDGKTISATGGGYIVNGTDLGGLSFKDPGSDALAYLYIEAAGRKSLVFNLINVNGYNVMWSFPHWDEVDAALDKKQDKLIAGENVTRTPQGDGTGKIDAAGGEIPIDTAMPASPADDHVPSTKLLKETADNVVKNGFLAYDHSRFQMIFGYEDGHGTGKDIGWHDSTTDAGCVYLWMGGNQASGDGRLLTTKAYVDGLVGDINAALAQI